MFRALSERLANVIVLNRDWTSATSPTVLGNTKSHSSETAVFLDPPYVNFTGGYAVGDGNSAAEASYRWAVKNGEMLRIAYCCARGEFPVPDGWDNFHVSFNGIRDPERRGKRDLVMFSPRCRRVGGLFG